MKLDRRNFILASAAGIACGYGVGLILPKSNEKELYLRPPGAVKDFEALCIKCGQCVQVCPYHSIDLLDINSGYSNGTSFIDPHKRGCYLCDLFPCVLACPSGALSHDTKEIKDVEMGVALLKNHSACLANKNEPVLQKSVERLLDRKIYNDREQAVKQVVKDAVDNKCDLCVKICPVGESAIIMAKDAAGKNLPLIKQGCVGCGACAEVCPVQIIHIAPNKKYGEIY